MKSDRSGTRLVVTAWTARSSVVSRTVRFPPGRRAHGNVAEDLGAQAAATHAEQVEIGQTALEGAGRECLDVRHPAGHGGGGVNPPEPGCDTRPGLRAWARKDGGVTGENASGQGQTPFAGTAKSPV